MRRLRRSLNQAKRWALMACVFCIASTSSRAAEFATVTPDQPLVFPQDTGAHPAFRTEWWYATGWLDQPDGKPLGFQITFFRSATGHDPADPGAFAPSQLIIAHAALSDPSLGRLVHDQKIARQGFGLAYAKTGNTDVKLDAWHLVRAADGHYTVTVNAANSHWTCRSRRPRNRCCRAKKVTREKVRWPRKRATTTANRNCA